MSFVMLKSVLKFDGPYKKEKKKVNTLLYGDLIS